MKRQTVREKLKGSWGIAEGRQHWFASYAAWRALCGKGFARPPEGQSDRLDTKKPHCDACVSELARLIIWAADHPSSPKRT